MKWNRKLLLAGMSAVLAAASCTAVSADTEEPVKVVAAVFPAYDWAREVIGEEAENIDLSLLMDSGADLHSYQPTVDDILTISACDIFIYVGGESDAWVSDALAQAVNEDMQVISLMDVLEDGVKEEELVEGMEAHDHDGHEAADDHEDFDDHEGHDEAPEYDEHVWLSLKNARVLVDAIAQAVSEADPDNAETYADNAEAYGRKLSELDEEYKAAVENGTHDTLLFGDRFPFRYLTDDYGLNYYAAFMGCSAETEASFETIIFLAGKMDELELPMILTIDGSDQSIAEAIRSSTKAKDQEIGVMDSMQNITPDEIEAGVSYLSIMEENLEVLKAALG